MYSNIKLIFLINIHVSQTTLFEGTCIPPAHLRFGQMATEYDQFRTWDRTVGMFYSQNVA